MNLKFLAKCKSGVQKLSEAVFCKNQQRKTVPLRSSAPLNFRTPYLPLNLNKIRSNPCSCSFIRNYWFACPLCCPCCEARRGRPCPPLSGGGSKELITRGSKPAASIASCWPGPWRIPASRKALLIAWASSAVREEASYCDKISATCAFCSSVSDCCA